MDVCNRVIISEAADSRPSVAFMHETVVNHGPELTADGGVSGGPYATLL